MPPRTPGSPISATDLARYARAWILDCRARGLSHRSTESYQAALDALLWWLGREKLPHCGEDELRGFLLYLRTAHDSPEGRLRDEPSPARRGSNAQHKPLSSRTLLNYYRSVRTLFAWMVEEGVAPASPFDRLRPPVHRASQVQPFTPDQVRALLDATRRSASPRRDRAIVLMLLDTGLRASELIALRWGDLDIAERTARVRGKGGKWRSVSWSGDTARAIVAYAKDRGRDDADPLFLSESGNTPGEALTRGGLGKIILRLGREAGIERAVRCSPHTLRHTFAVMFLRAGGNVFSLKAILGHESLEMTNRYVALAQADLSAQHRQFSPVAALRRPV